MSELEQGTQGFLGGAAAGAGIGALGGPPGMAAGAIIGGSIGLFAGILGAKARKKAERRHNEEQAAARKMAIALEINQSRFGVFRGISGNVNAAIQATPQNQYEGGPTTGDKLIQYGTAIGGLAGQFKGIQGSDKKKEEEGIKNLSYNQSTPRSDTWG